MIVYDSDWNPQSDFQAIDRVHRIGQQKQVHIFRLVTENTIDHRIVQRAKVKQRLDKIVIHHGQKQSKEDSTSNWIAGIKFDVERAMLNDTIREDFDLERIIKESAVKDAAEEKRLEKMTLDDISSSSVYQFEGLDYRVAAGPSVSN